MHLHLQYGILATYGSLSFLGIPDPDRHALDANSDTAK
jgi:hypothetical protein